MAKAPPRFPKTTAALVVVLDRALATSLASMLEAYGVTCAIHDPKLGLTSLPLGEDTHLVVDFKLFRDPGLFLSDLRAAGWRGAAILMTERALDGSWRLPERCWTVEKPFVAADLLAILRWVSPDL